MIACSHPPASPILVAASIEADIRIVRAASEELGVVPVLVQDTTAAVRLLCRRPRGFAALIAGERTRATTSGLTLCGVARDAGCRLPMILVTSDACPWTAVRAALLEVSVLWQPVSARRVAQTLCSLLLDPDGVAPSDRRGRVGTARMLGSCDGEPSQTIHVQHDMGVGAAVAHVKTRS